MGPSQALTNSFLKAVEQEGHRSRSCDFVRWWEGGGGGDKKKERRRQRCWAVVESEMRGGKKEDIPQLITENGTNSGGRQTVI